MQQKVFKSGTPRVPYLMNQIAASYIKLGKPINAIEWANKGIALSKEKTIICLFIPPTRYCRKISLDKK